jgi:Flp pilus assembly pilin Flp
MWQRFFVILLAEKETGQDLVEYALILAFVALIVAGSLALFGGDLKDYYGAIATGLPFGS